MTFKSLIRIITRPAANLPAADRLRLFREGRIVSAAIALVMFPLLAVYSGEPPAVTASLLLVGLLPAVLALDGLRPATLDRVTVMHVVITSVVLTAGTLRGLPPASAILLTCLVLVEASVVARARGRTVSAVATLAGILAIAISAQHAAVDPLVHSGSSLAIAALAIASTLMLIRGLILMFGRERKVLRLDRVLSQEIESVVSETVLAVDAAGRVIRVSANAERVLGLPGAALMGQGLSELTLVADRPVLLTAFALGNASAERRTIRFRLRQSVGSAAPRYRWAALQLEPMNKAGLTMAALTDISALVVEEERAQAAATEAETAKRARSSFLSTVNHELRTPLNAIIGFSDILANPVTTPRDAERVQEYARIVNGAGQDLLRMVSAMIDITRLDTGIYEFEPEDADVTALVESAVEAFRQEPEARNETFKVKAPADPLHASIDARAFRSVLTELLSNAAKFGNGHGIGISLAACNGDITIAVSDRGGGIEAEKLAQLGRHFARADEALTRDRGGIGLGLSLARGLMALHGGHISMASTPGKGTTVTLHLPGTTTATAVASNVLPLSRARSVKGATTKPKVERKRA